MTEPPDQWLSLPEAATQLGISENALRSRVKRRTVRTRKANDGRLMVCLPGPDGGTSTMVRPKSDPGSNYTTEPPQALTPESPVLVSLVDVRAMLGEQRACHAADMAALRSDMGAERQRHLAELTRIERAYQSAADALMAKVSAVLVASRPRRSWWRW